MERWFKVIPAVAALALSAALVVMQNSGGLFA
jgi:hypothetical protein